MFKFTLALNDGTNGTRFDVLGIKGLYRVRKVKNRYGLALGDSFMQAHIGKRSLYIERQFNKTLGDWALRDFVNAYRAAIVAKFKRY